MAKFNTSNFAFRWLGALLLVGITFNPTQWSYYHWVAANPQHLMPMKILAGLFLLVGYVVFLRATLRSIGPLGIFLTVAICGTIVWMLIDLNWLQVNNHVLAWIGVVVAATVLAVGISWSHLRRRWSGQIDADDLDQ